MPHFINGGSGVFVVCITTRFDSFAGEKGRQEEKCVGVKWHVVTMLDRGASPEIYVEIL